MANKNKIDFPATLLAWRDNDWNQVHTAAALNLPRETLRHRVREGLRWLKTKPGKDWAKEVGFELSVTEKLKSGSPEVHVAALQGQVKELERRVKEADAEKLSADAVRELLDLGDYVPTAPEWANDREIGKYNHGIPWLELSDIHYGEMVDPRQVFGANKFNTEICATRLQHTVDTANMLLGTVLDEPKFPGFVLGLGGDLINGAQEIMHPELHLGGEPIMRQILGIAELIHAIIKKQIKVYGKVFVPGVAGNHGRNTRKSYAKFYAETNFDWIVYQLLERWLAQEVRAGQVVFLCPPARDITFKVAGHAYRMTHGDQFRGGDGIIGPLGPIKRGDNKKRGQASTLPTRGQEYETLVVHHFHTLYQNRKLILNGSVKGFDEYALSCNFEYEPPMQALWLTHEKFGMNHFMPVLCEEPPLVKATEWVSFPQAPNNLATMERLSKWAEK